MRLLQAIMTMVLLPTLVSGQQNLVPNPSFEENSDCPHGAGQWYLVSEWVNANISSPDYFHTCAVASGQEQSTVGVPNNLFGYQHPLSGHGYMGFYAYQNINEAREYLQVELTESIVASVRYLVSFHITLAESSSYAVRTIGAYLSIDAIGSENHGRLDFEPQVLYNGSVPLTDTVGWMMVSDTMVSRFGGEQFITIGNFHADSISGIELFNPNATGFLRGYYYIDDISVIALDSLPDNIAEQAQLSFTLWPNPASNVLHIQGKLPFARLRLLDISGRAVLSENIITDRHTLQLAGIPPGLYLLEATDTEGRSAVRKVVVSH